MRAVIFNSGLGSRLKGMTKDKPKCMIELYNGETIFERQIRILNECGISEFVVTTGPYKEQLMQIAKSYPNLSFIFVDNADYRNTNYIVSMNKAYNFLDEEVLLLHGDLVFNKNLVLKLLADSRASLCLFNEEKELPQKDFKARFNNNQLKMVSIDIFEDCYAFQPFYKLSKEDIHLWRERVAQFVEEGKVSVYAENALNEITNDTKIYGLSYKDDFIEEIDTIEDYNRVSEGIRYFDYKEQTIISEKPYIEELKHYIDENEPIFIVAGKIFLDKVLMDFNRYNIDIFSDYSVNPNYEDIKKGLIQFRKKEYKLIISIGGGSTIDMAKCIKLFSTMKNEFDFLEKKFIYNRIRHIAIPTTAGTGSESTQMAVMYYEGEKKSIEHGSILPDVVILDNSLLGTLPDYQKKSALLDSLCQSIESYWAKGATDESKSYARKSIILIMKNYKKYLANDTRIYKEVLLASNYSGKAINISKTTAAHAMSYRLAALYNISHGHSVALCIIPVWKLLNNKAEKSGEIHKKLIELAEIMKAESIEKAIDIFEAMLCELALPEIRIRTEDIELLVNTINIERMSNNPIIFTNNDIEKIYKSI